MSSGLGRLLVVDGIQEEDLFFGCAGAVPCRDSEYRGSLSRVCAFFYLVDTKELSSAFLPAFDGA